MEIIKITICASLFFLLGFGLKQDSDLSRVERVQGVLIFTDSKPVSNYKYLGTVRVDITWDGAYKTVRNALLKRTKKKYPNAQGIVLDINHGTSRADVIQFTD